MPPQLHLGPAWERVTVIGKHGHRITTLLLAAYISLYASYETYAQDFCNLAERVVELLSTIDACAATGDQLAELELVRQQIVEPYAETDCGELHERISALELTLPRRPTGWPTNLDQPVPMCEATQRAPANGVTLVETAHE